MNTAMVWHSASLVTHNYSPHYVYFMTECCGKQLSHRTKETKTLPQRTFDPVQICSCFLVSKPYQAKTYYVMYLTGAELEILVKAALSSLIGVISFSFGFGLALTLLASQKFLCSALFPLFFREVYPVYPPSPISSL